MVAQGKLGFDPLMMETSFDTLLAGERSRLVGFCAHLTGNPGVAEDLAQETLLEAWRNQHKLCAQDRVSPENRIKWLQAIARNVCLRWGRRHGRDLAHLAQYTLSAASDSQQELDLDELPDGGESLDVELERDELTQLLDRALALLPPTTRAVLIERYIHESPHAEIAERLGLSEDALVQRLYRGKLALRRVMENELNAEAATYGLVDPRRADEPEPLEQETRIWCPMCNKHRLIKYYDPASNRTGFTCPGCWQLASVPLSSLGACLRSPKSVLTRQLAYLSDYYWSAINGDSAICPDCRRPAMGRIVAPKDIPEAFYSTHGWRPYHGISIRCDVCQDEEFNLLPHLTIDVPEAQQFWRVHPRMFWLPEREIDYAGQAALLSGFQSASDSARLDIVYQRETLRILGIHETTC
jgi:RNA polymerase sigma-70 factor (ECF subfamily)